MKNLNDHLKFLKRAYSDYKYYTLDNKKIANHPVTTTPVNKPDLDEVVTYFKTKKVGVIYQSHFILRLVVKNYHAPKIFSQLSSLLPDAEYLLNKETIKSKNLKKIRLSLVSQELKCSYTKNNRVYDIFIETYFRQSKTGKWQCANDTNPLCRIITDSFWNTHAQLKEKLVATSRALANRTGDTDVVYTWANVYDLDWMNLRAHFSNEREVEATSRTRINDNSELKYSIRSVKLNMPWIRNIYIISNGKPPEWLELEADSSITWITHDKIIDEVYLPTFNSHVIESNLHKIPGLSEKFIYMNDDIMVVTPIDRSYFFELNGQPIAKMEAYGIVNGEVEGEAPDYLNASRNSANLLYNDYDYYPTRLHEHCPQILDRDILAEIERKYSNQFHDFRKNRFRSINDINVTSFLYHHYAYITKRGVINSTYTNKLIKSSSTWKKHLEEFPSIKYKYKTLCLNEGCVISEDWCDAIPVFLDELFPHKGDWEKY